MSHTETLTIGIIDSDRARRRGWIEILQMLTTVKATRVIANHKELLAKLEQSHGLNLVIIAADGETALPDVVRALTTAPTACPPLMVLVPSSKLGTPLVARLYEAGVAAIITDPITVDSVSDTLSKVIGSDAMRTFKERTGANAMRITMRMATKVIDQRATDLREEKSTRHQVKKEWRELKAYIREKVPTLPPDDYLKVLESELSAAEPMEERVAKKVRTKKQLVHPAVLVRQMMVERKLTEARFKELMKVDDERLAEFLAEKAPISPDIAAALSRVLGKDPVFWLTFRG